MSGSAMESRRNKVKQKMRFYHHKLEELEKECDRLYAQDSEAWKTLYAEKTRICRKYNKWYRRMYPYHV